MSKVLKVVLVGGCGLFALLGLGVGALLLGFPRVSPASELKAPTDQASQKRGEYLAHHVAVCMDCHAERDWTHFAAPPKPGTEGSGGDRFPRELGFPGNFYAKNITPAGVGGWTDGELARAITTGVRPDGEALFPLMPYQYYKHLCEEDVGALVAYLRTLRPVEKAIPERELDFPMPLVLRTIPADPEPWSCPKPGTPESGKYLTQIAGCAECHTEQHQGSKVGPLFAGGWRMPLGSGGWVTTANITPDQETGIGRWSKEQFIATFKRRANEPPARVKAGEFNTLMPWTMYGGMTEEDLGTIYDYLRTVPAVRRAVTKFEAAP